MYRLKRITLEVCFFQYKRMVSDWRHVEMKWKLSRDRWSCRVGRANSQLPPGPGITTVWGVETSVPPTWYLLITHTCPPIRFNHRWARYEISHRTTGFEWLKWWIFCGRRTQLPPTWKIYHPSFFLGGGSNWANSQSVITISCWLCTPTRITEGRGPWGHSGCIPCWMCFMERLDGKKKGMCVWSQHSEWNWDQSSPASGTTMA